MTLLTPSPLAASSPLTHVLPHKLFEFSFAGRTIAFTNHMLMLSIVALLMLLTFSWMGISARNPNKRVPTGFGNFFEAILAYLRNDVFKPALGPHTDRFVPFLWTTFFFILFANLIGLIPTAAFLGLIDAKFHLTPHGSLAHLGGTATANLAVTAALALAAFIFIHVSGILQQIRIQMNPSLDPHHHGHDHGHAHAHGKPFVLALPVGFLMYWKNFVPAVPLLLWPLMFVLELIGAMVKPFSLAIRLFANMVAGHLVLGVLISLGILALSAGVAIGGGVSIAVVLGCAGLNILELFVAFLQAYIFTFLTTLFIAAAVAPEH